MKRRHSWKLYDWAMFALSFILFSYILFMCTVIAMAQGPYFGRGKPTGPPTVSSLTADEATSLNTAQAALTTAAQNLAAARQRILAAHGDKPCLPTDSSCTRASFRQDGFIETVTYTQTPRAVPAITPKPATPGPVAH